ncbi:MAG: SMP-30/gluconolactonase/LRE family protein [Alphaproteobacteria bacterium]
MTSVPQTDMPRMTTTPLAWREVARGLAFPEGPVAMADGSIVLVEIKRGTVTRVSPDGTPSVIADLGGGPNGAAIGPDGALYVCNNGGFRWHDVNGLTVPGERADDYETGRIERVDLSTGAVTRLYESCDGNRLNGPNDIVFDAAGGFFFTDLGKSYGRVRDRGAVFYARPDGSMIREVIFPVESPNGVGLSPNGNTLYFADTVPATLWAYPVAGPGEIVRGRGFFRGTPLAHPQGYQFFDSLAVEADGTVCVATIIRGGITRIAADGSAIDHVPTDDLMTTNICFGGPDLRTAYVTCSATGRLMAADWPAPGLRLNFGA